MTGRTSISAVLLVVLTTILGRRARAQNLTLLNASCLYQIHLEQWLASRT